MLQANPEEFQLTENRGIAEASRYRHVSQTREIAEVKRGGLAIIFQQRRMALSLGRQG